MKLILSTMNGKELIAFWALENDAVITRRYGEQSKLYFKWPLKDGQISAVAECLKQDSVLSNVQLDGCQLGDTRICILASALRYSPTLLSLNLGRNEIGPKGADALAVALSKSNATITDLNLCNNNIGDAGASYLAKMLLSNSSLRILGLALNEIGDTGCMALAASLARNTRVRLSGMDSPRISEAGYKALLPFASRIQPDPATQIDHLGDLRASDTKHRNHSSKIRSRPPATSVAFGRSP